MKGFELVCLLAITIHLPAEAYSIAIADANEGALSYDYDDDLFTGYLASHYQCAVDTVDKPFTVSILPQVRALRMLHSNKVDMVVPMAHSSERDEIAYFSIPLFTVRYLLYTLPDVALAGNEPRFQIAVNWSSASITLIEGLGHGVIPVDHHELAIGMVKRGRAHGVLIPQSSATAMTEALEGLVPHDYAQLPGGAYINKINTELQVSFDRAVQECSPKN